MPFLKSSHSHSAEIVQKDRDVFRSFNKHAKECSRCARPLETARQGKTLCDKGHAMAYDIANLIYAIAGRKADEYRVTTGWCTLLMDVTELHGPAKELVKALEYGLQERKPSSVKPGVFSAEPKPVSRHSTYHHEDPHSASARHYTHHSHDRSSRYYESVAPRIEVERSPRASGSLRVHTPVAQPDAIEYAREEYHHPSGGKVTTKYYQQQRPALQRSNTTGHTGVVKTISTGKSGSRVRFNEEVKYYT